VDSSDEAYSLFWTGDAFLAVTSYATTATLAAMGGADRAHTRPWIPLAMTAKIVFDAIVAGILIWIQAARIRAYCWLCLLASALTFAMLPLAMGEARTALTAWRNGTADSGRGRTVRDTPRTPAFAVDVFA
jgi:uncharacterized membrane protein